MSRILLINAALGEVRFALLEDDRPVEIRLFRDHAPSLVGAIYLGRVRHVSKEFQAAFVELDDGTEGFLPLTLLAKKPGKKPRDLTDALNEGEKIIVQVTQDAHGDKSPKLTGRVELTGGAIVLHPFRAGAFVSSRIKDPDRRQELKVFGEKLQLDGLGLTFRTDAEHVSLDKLKDTAQRLIAHWKDASADLRKRRLLCQGPDPIAQIMRDHAIGSIDQILIDQPAVQKKALDWARTFAPELVDKITSPPEKTPLFDLYGVEDELENMTTPRIDLPSGAWITMEETEALCVIDVNMGRALLSRDREQQIMRVNREAASEIFRQLRLRGMGGIIVIDFIDMSAKGQVIKFLDHVDSLILRDPQQVQRSNISAFGLLELTRKARHLPLSHLLLTKPTPELNLTSHCLTLLRRAERDARSKPGQPWTIKVDKAAKTWFEDHHSLVDEFVRRTGCPLKMEDR